MLTCVLKIAPCEHTSGSVPFSGMPVRTQFFSEKSPSQSIFYEPPGVAVLSFLHFCSVNSAICHRRSEDVRDSQGTSCWGAQRTCLHDASHSTQWHKGHFHLHPYQRFRSLPGSMSPLKGISYWIQFTLIAFLFFVPEGEICQVFSILFSLRK